MSELQSLYANADSNDAEDILYCGRMVSTISSAVAAKREDLTVKVSKLAEEVTHAEMACEKENKAEHLKVMDELDLKEERLRKEVDQIDMEREALNQAIDECKAEAMVRTHRAERGER